MGESHVNLTAKRLTTTAEASSNGKKPRIDADYLFQGNTEIVIVHQNEEYHLRITKNGKLILTK